MNRKTTVKGVEVEVHGYNYEAYGSTVRWRNGRYNTEPLLPTRAECIQCAGEDPKGRPITCFTHYSGSITCYGCGRLILPR